MRVEIKQTRARRGWEWKPPSYSEIVPISPKQSHPNPARHEKAALGGAASAGMTRQEVIMPTTASIPESGFHCDAQTLAYAQAQANRTGTTHYIGNIGTYEPTGADPEALRAMGCPLVVPVQPERPRIRAGISTMREAMDYALGFDRENGGAA